MSEKKIACPSCGRNKCFLNTAKKVAQCFRPSCGWKAGPAKLISLGLISPLGLQDLATQLNTERSVGRAHWWYHNNYQRYKYPKNISTTNYLFNWDECKNFEYLTIVENTFNAIRYRKLINSTSSFGSRLSKTQVRLIAQSRVNFCIILFDSGAERKSELAVSELRDSGVNAVRLKIAGQPDDYSNEYIVQLVESVK